MTGVLLNLYFANRSSQTIAFSFLFRQFFFTNLRTVKSLLPLNPVNKCLMMALRMTQNHYNGSTWKHSWTDVRMTEKILLLSRNITVFCLFHSFICCRWSQQYCSLFCFFLFICSPSFPSLCHNFVFLCLVWLEGLNR